eukprot:5016300-Pleurochrysis_carterae.AAC.2
MGPARGGCPKKGGVGSPCSTWEQPDSLMIPWPNLSLFHAPMAFSMLHNRSLFAQSPASPSMSFRKQLPHQMLPVGREGRPGLL